MSPKSVPPDIKALLESTYNGAVRSKVGDYAGLVDFEDMELVVSTDGVGTKILIACNEAEIVWPNPYWPHRVIGEDLVNHCVNDILVTGAVPLCFANTFSYSDDIAGARMKHVVAGMAQAAKKVNLPIVTGETAKMYGFYPHGVYDVVGTIIGSVNPHEKITGEKVKPGDKLLGLPSSGPHTNGYTTIRRIYERELNERYWIGTDDDKRVVKSLGMSIREAVMQPHRCYYHIVRDLMSRFSVHALAHITGKGIDGNLQRVLNGHKHLIDYMRERWPVLFQMIQNHGQLTYTQMREEFNLGVGMIVVVPEDQFTTAYSYLRTVGESPIELGEVV